MGKCALCEIEITSGIYCEKCRLLLEFTTHKKVINDRPKNQ